MKKYSIFFGLLFLLGACKSPKYLSTPSEFKNHVKGLYFECYTKNEYEVLGEIIEVTPSEIKILLLDSIGVMKTFTKDEIEDADIIISLTSDQPKDISTLAALTNLATLGHGLFMILTVPINLITTTTIANSAAKSTYRVKYPKDIAWQEMSKFARFPQGIPECVDSTKIK